MAARAIVVLLLFAASTLAAPQPTHLFPAGGEPGKTITVDAAGKFDTWPVKAWVDREGVTVEAAKDKGKLSVTVAADARPGVYRIRLHDETGASSLLPFVVDALPSVDEAEYNDLAERAQKLPGSAVVNGKLAKRNDVDSFAIELKAGQTLVASMLAHNVLGSPMDGVLQVANTEGTTLAQNDDGRNLDPLLVYEAPADGVYLVRAFAFPETATSSINYAGEDSFVYRLTITAGGYIDHAWPLATPNDGSAAVELRGWNLPDDAAVDVTPQPDGLDAVVASPAAANAIVLPVVAAPLMTADEAAETETGHAITPPVCITGRIDKPGDEDVFTFAAKKDQSFDIRVESRALGFALDGQLRVTDADGKTLAEEDDTNKQPDPALTFKAPADGEYRVIVRDLAGHGGFRYVYRLTIAPAEPDYTLAVEADTFVVSPGKPVEVTVNVSREHGFAGDVEVTAVDLPEGVTATAVVSEGKGKTAKQVKVKLEASKDAAAPAAGVFRIVGRVKDEDERVAVFTDERRAHRHARLWMTVGQ